MHPAAEGETTCAVLGLHQDEINLVLDNQWLNGWNCLVLLSLPTLQVCVATLCKPVLGCCPDWPWYAGLSSTAATPSA